MSLQFWDEQPPLFALNDPDILLAIDDTDNTSKQFNASILKPYVQATLVTDVDAASFNVSNLDVLTFANDTGALGATDYGIVRDGSSLTFNIGNALDSYFLNFNGSTVHTFTNTEFTTPSISITGTGIDLSGGNIINVGFFESNAANPAQSGILRLGNATTHEWRNAANTADLGIGYNASDVFVIDGDLDVPAGSISAGFTYLYANGSTQFEASNPDGIGWDISTIGFKQIFSLSAEDTSIQDIFFLFDEKKMYTVGQTNDRVYRYDLGTAGDVSTAVFVNFFQVAGGGVIASGLSFRPDGEKMYVTDRGNNNIYEYDLDPGGDITTAVLVNTFNVAAQDGGALAVRFKADGKLMFMLGNAGDNVYLYSLTTPWDLSTATFTGIAFFVGNEDVNPNGLEFSHDGTEMYMVGFVAETLFQYHLNVPWDLTTAVLTRSVPLSTLTSNFSDPTGIFIRSDATKIYITEAPISSVVEFNLGLISKEQQVETLGTTTKLIYSQADFPPKSGNTITLEGKHYIIAASFDLDADLVVPASTSALVTSTDRRNITLNFTRDSGTLFTSSGANLLISELRIELSGDDQTLFAGTTGNYEFVNSFAIFTGTGTRTVGTLTGINVCVINNSGIFDFTVGIDIDANILALTEATLLVHFPTVVATTLLTISDVGTTALLENISGVSNSADDVLLDIDSAITDPITIRGVINAGPATFYDAGGLDQTSIHVTATGNTGSPNSLTTGQFSFLNIATPETVTIVTESVPVAIAGGAWTSSSLEGMTADVGDNGIATITALKTGIYQINFSALMEKVAGGATEIALTILINGTDTTVNAPRSVNAGIIQISGSRLFSLSTGDTVQLAVFNDDGTANIDISQADMTIVGATA